MALVAGVDFGTQSVRVSIFDSNRGRLGTATAEYPLLRSRDEPDKATQRHQDHMSALVSGLVRALSNAGAVGSQIEAIACCATGSTIVPVGAGLQPIGDY